MSRTALYRGVSPYCDHHVRLTMRCAYCEAAERRMTYRPRVSLDHFGRLVLGCCDSCGVDVLVSDHLFKQPSGEYVCEDCDIVTQLKREGGLCG